MKALWWLVVVSALLIGGCGSEEPKVLGKETPVPEKPVDPVVVGDYALGTAITEGNVTVIPVTYTKQIQQSGDEITLAEAKKLGLVEIIEIPGEEQVNKLRVHNKSDRPLLLLGGELLLGGKQDRIVMHDVIISPGITLDVDVNCVEHGRWEGTSVKFSAAEVMVPHSVREAANYEDQDKVWAGVATYNSTASPAKASTGTTVQIGLNSPEVEAKIKAALPTFIQKLEQQKGTVGMIYLLNGEIMSMDLFGNPATFQASKKSLLNSYLAEGAVTKGEAKAKLTDDALRGFLKDFYASQTEKKKDMQGLVQTNGVTLRGREVTKDGSIGVAGAAGFVHGSYSKKK